MTVNGREAFEALYNVTTVGYVTKRTRCTITCANPLCKYEFTTTPAAFAKRKTRCCTGDKLLQLRPQELVNGRSAQVDYAKVLGEIERVCGERDGTCLNPESYQNAASPLAWRCGVCQYQWQAAMCDISPRTGVGSWCPNCATAKDSEKRCRAILEYLFPDHKFPSIRPDFLRYENGARLELDCYNDELGVALEYNGIQHYRLVPYFHRPANSDSMTEQEIELAMIKNFLQDVVRDTWKANRCMEDDVMLVTVSNMDMKRGIPYVKQMIYHELQDLITEHPTHEWLESDSLDVCRDRTFEVRKKKLLDYMAENTPNYKLEDPNVVIVGGRHKFNMICDKGHVYDTDTDHFTSSESRCRECLRIANRNTLQSVESTIQQYYDFVSVPDQEYTSNKDKLKLYCTVCNETFYKILNEVKRSNKRGHVVHRGCEA